MAGTHGGCPSSARAGAAERMSAASAAIDSLMSVPPKRRGTYRARRSLDCTPDPVVRVITFRAAVAGARVVVSELQCLATRIHFASRANPILSSRNDHHVPPFRPSLDTPGHRTRTLPAGPRSVGKPRGADDHLRP